MENSTLTFVISIWIDVGNENDNGGRPTWRGEIRNVLEGETARVAFDSLEEIAAHIRPYLQAQGVL
ncbi:MAG: hypothetical protein R3293_26150 [Candidatus Promineifilaceae bacterium]|nr:hypothetical protein [Candidatus Promineifilaceae bacterium]